MVSCESERILETPILAEQHWMEQLSVRNGAICLLQLFKLCKKSLCFEPLIVGQCRKWLGNLHSRVVQFSNDVAEVHSKSLLVRLTTKLSSGGGRVSYEPENAYMPLHAPAVCCSAWFGVFGLRVVELVPRRPVGQALEELLLHRCD